MVRKAWNKAIAPFKKQLEQKFHKCLDNLEADCYLVAIQASVCAFGTVCSLRLLHLPTALDFSLLGAAPPNPHFSF
jgi:hypothetical protein